LAGEIEHFTGVNDPYEAPLAPEIHIHSDKDSIEDSVDRILNYLKSKELIS
jgi:adenylylsulfate kinase